jgi:hypothetical protein
MVGFTEGPWRWHWRFENGEANGSVYAELREGHAYAVAICPRYQTKEQWEKDAPLLAAAKDMLGALEIACETAEYLANWDKSPQSKWYYAAKAAIEKARGQYV